MIDATDKNGDKRNPDGTFAEGNHGGPGRPKFSLVAMLKEELQKCPDGQDKITYANLLIRRILKEAIENGDPQQIKNILNYVEGLPKATIEHSGKLTLEEFLNDNDETGDNKE